jgi:uncharacterized protein (TIGR03084 family)
VSESAVARLCAELADEHESLDELVAGLDDSGWRLPTPAPGWDIGDQVSHLAFFDDAARLAVADPGGFQATRPTDEAGLAALIAGAGARGRALSHADLLAWWRRARTELCEVAVAATDGTRVPWYGPSMSMLSFVTARLMETWAHGQDIADALGVTRPATPRLRHVAQLGVLAFANSFRANGVAVPEQATRVELCLPTTNDVWTWGDEGCTDVVRGDALDFCLVVTQRRHLADTRLHVEGPVARQWMAMAQAFAGPPGPGRRAGQFAPVRP